MAKSLVGRHAAEIDGDLVGVPDRRPTSRPHPVRWSATWADGAGGPLGRVNMATAWAGTMGSRSQAIAAGARDAPRG
jgi:hypothetical protein